MLQTVVGPLRIAHIITRMIIGGAQENTLLNCLDLVRGHGDEVILITGPSLGPEGDLLSQGRAGELSIRLVPSLRRAIHPYRDWKAAGEIRTILKSFRPDVVHTHSAKGGLLGRKVGWGLKKDDPMGRTPAVIHTVHGAPFHDFQSGAARVFFQMCERWAAKRCDHLISVADAMTDLMVAANIAPRDKFSTIYSGMNVDPFVNASRHRAEVRSRLGIHDDQIVIGKIARLFHLKGHSDLISAAPSIVAENPNVKFLLVGDGVLRQSLQQQIESLKLSQHFLFTGLVPPNEVPSLIGAMDVLVHTSLREGLARALPQALLAGIPAVSYDIDGAREVVINGQTGCLIAPGDVNGLAKSLSNLAADSETRTRLGREGQRRFTQQFSHQNMTRQIRSLYEQVLSSLSG